MDEWVPYEYDYNYDYDFDYDYDDDDSNGSDRYDDSDSYDGNYSHYVRKGDRESYDEDGTCLFENSSHCHELLAELNSQRQTGNFLDVVVKVQSRKIRCHRAVLASTPYFKAMLSSKLTERKSKVVRLHGIDSISFSKVLDFLYTGEIRIGKDDVQDILQAAHMLQIDKITEYCRNFIEKNLSLSNCIGVMRLADLYGFSDLREKARDEALSQFSELGGNEEFLTLSTEELMDLLKDENLRVADEEEVLDAVIRWLDHDPENRSTAIVTIFQEIRLPSVRVIALMKLESHPVIQGYAECLTKATAAKEKHLATTRRVIASAEVEEAILRPRLGTSDDLAIIVGGWKINKEIPLNCVICLEPDSEQCYRVSNLPTPVSGYMSVTNAEGHLYVTGGRVHPLVGDQGPHSAPSRQAFRYDFPTDTWSELPDMPRGRAGHKSVVVDGKLFLVGGDTDDTPGFSIDCYDLEEGAWINPPTFPAIDRSSDLARRYDGMLQQKDVVDSIIYYKFDEDNRSTSSDEPDTTLDIPFDLVGHSFLGAKKSSIGWYCRDLDKLENEDDETDSSDRVVICIPVFS
ncbi:KLHL24 [Branchiostoma lanceolatum]|uniref:KLHL24 protein n=1 Tax=Branchiostoma lanceolatum TaxID=7740 RepID=A0A8K0A8B0_BRALA|nr:KLHL24 [Branchiostoma lanceolatum]